MLEPSLPHGTQILSLQVNDDCNLACVYCPEDLHGGGQALTREQFLEVLARAQAAGCFRLALGGGEPTLWPHLDWAVRMARERGFQVTVTTNARSPEGAAGLSVDSLGVSAGKGRWRQLGARSGSMANIVHRGGRMRSTLLLAGRAVVSGYRRLALLPYKGPHPAMRASQDELAVLAWLSGHWTRAGMEVGLDSYGYRRLGLVEGCGHGFARLTVQGDLQGCCFTGCEFYPDRARSFAAEQALDRASRPARPILLVENSEPGYVILLSDGLEASLSQLPWQTVLEAQQMLVDVAAQLGEEEARLAAALEPQMSDDGRAPPPMLGTVDLDADRAVIEHIVDACGHPLLSGRPVEFSVLLREAGTVGRAAYIRDLAFDLGWDAGEPSIPPPVLSRRLRLSELLPDRLTDLDYARQEFGWAFARSALQIAEPLLRSLAVLEFRAAKTDVARWTWDEGGDLFPWLCLGAAMGHELESACAVYLARLDTLAERLGKLLLLYQVGPHTPWVRRQLARHIAEARSRYTAEGRAAVRLALQEARRGPPPWPLRRQTPGTARSAASVPARLADYRRQRLSHHLRARLNDHWMGRPIGPTARDLARDWLRLLRSAVLDFAQEDLQLAPAAGWGDWPDYAPPADRASLWADPLARYVVATHQPGAAPDPEDLARWARIALDVGPWDRSEVWLEAALGRLDAESRLTWLEPVILRLGPLRQRVRQELWSLARHPDPVGSRAQALLAEIEEQDRHWQSLFGPSGEP